MPSILKDFLAIALIILGLVFGLAIVKNFKTKEQLKQTVQTQGTVIKDLNTSNDNLHQAIETKNKSETITTDVVKENIEVKEKHEVKVAEQTVKTQKKIQNIKVEFEQKIAQAKTPEESATLVEKRAKSISQARIESLWANYCNFESNDSECKANL